MKPFNVLGKKIIIKKVELPMNIAGETDFNTQILINKNLTNKREIENTVLHELIHCVFERSGLNQTRISRDLQEILCEVIPTVILDNYILRRK